MPRVCSQTSAHQGFTDFDPLFASSHDKFGAADQFTWINISHVRSGIQSQVLNA